KGCPPAVVVRVRPATPVATSPPIFGRTDLAADERIQPRLAPAGARGIHAWPRRSRLVAAPEEHDGDRPPLHVEAKPAPDVEDDAHLSLIDGCSVDHVVRAEALPGRPREKPSRVLPKACLVHELLGARLVER